MTLAVVVLSFTVAALAVAVAVVALIARRAIRDATAEAAVARAERDADGFAALVGQRVVANVRDGGAIRGVLTHVYVNAIVLEHPEYVAGARPAGIGSEVTLDRANVPMLQRFEEVT